MLEPKVSLIIATYDRGAQIAPTLDSMLAQTRLPDEVVVVDDGSTDGTGDWIRSRYPMAHVISTANGGTSRARNRGAREARGDVLIFLDHDDILHPHAVARLTGLLTRFPEARAAFADHTYRNEVTSVRRANHHDGFTSFHRLRDIPAGRREGPARLYGRAMHRALLRGNLLQQPWAIDRATFLELGGFEPSIRYCEDWDLYLRVAATVPLVLSDEVISDHVVEGGNLHLAPGQEEMQRRVLLRQFRASFPARPRALAVICAGLAIQHKAVGDRSWPGDPLGSWGHYARSLVTWPFDPIVLARVLSRAPAALVSLARSLSRGPRGQLGDADRSVRYLPIRGDTVPAPDDRNATPDP